MGQGPQGEGEMEYEVMIIEDSPFDADCVSRQLQRAPLPVNVRTFPRLADGISAALCKAPDVILLDLNLPDSQGYSTFHQVKSAEIPSPVVIVSGNGDIAIALQCVSHGAQDYLVKGTFGEDTIFRSLLFAVERDKARIRLESQALSDELTGLFNRRGFYQAGAQLMNTARRLGAEAFALFVDVDGMKGINDRHGHSWGDKALVALSSVLKRSMRANDIIGRIGGDEFAVLGLGVAGSAADCMKRIHDELVAFNATRACPFLLGASIGTADMDAYSYKTLEEQIESADKSMYEAKWQARRHGDAPTKAR